MTNEEPQKIELQSNRTADYKNKIMEHLNYDATEWGLFYSGYKEVGQLQLQKMLEKTKNEWTRVRKLDYAEKVKYTQHIYYKTEWSEKEDCFITPKVVLRAELNSRTSQDHVSAKWADAYRSYKETNKAIFDAYYTRLSAEYKEVKAYYIQRKDELEREQKVQHQINANAEVECPCCKAKVARTNLARHRKSKKCLKASEEAKSL